MPALVVETVAADDIGLLIPLLDARDPLLFIRRGEGVAGIGEALRLEFTGKKGGAICSAISVF